MSAEYGVTSDKILAVMHDCASTNTVAMRTMRVIYSMAVDIGCFSHTLDRDGERFDVPTLQSFMVYWIGLFSHSSKAKLFWKQKNQHKCSRILCYTLVEQMGDDKPNF